MINESVQTGVREIIEAETARLEALKAFDDLTGLYGDIRVALSRRAPDCECLIDAYAELMAREQKLCCPETAYNAGREAAASGRESNLMEYVSRVFCEPGNLQFLSERDNLFYRLYGLLGEAYGLIDEYNEQYRTCHGFITRNIDQFYNMGYRRVA
jgi:hypothetical protein